MSTKAQKIRSSKSSNEESFEALNENTQNAESQKSRPSNSSDFENINDRKIQEIESHHPGQQRHSNVQQELQNLQKLIIKSEKSIQEQFEILKEEYQEREKEILALKGQNDQLKKCCVNLQKDIEFYKEECQKTKKQLQQQQDVSGSLQKVQDNPEKDFSKKKVLMNVTSFDDDLNDKVKECEFKIHSLQMKLEFFAEEDKKVRDFLNKALKFNPSFPMQLSTLVESAVIQLDSNLKEVNREMEEIILGAHLGNSNKIMARRENMEEEKYNHWEALSNIDVIKEYVSEYYRSK